MRIFVQAPESEIAHSLSKINEEFNLKTLSCLKTTYMYCIKNSHEINREFILRAKK